MFHISLTLVEHPHSLSCTFQSSQLHLSARVQVEITDRQDGKNYLNKLTSLVCSHEARNLSEIRSSFKHVSHVAERRFSSQCSQ